MSVTRRNFLSRAAVAMLTGAILPRAFAQSSSSFFDNISAETFKPFLGDRFGVALNGRSQGWLTLTAVSQSPTASSRASAGAGSKSPTQVLDTFTLKFRRAGAPLPQETYTLSQLSLGSFPLFLVPLSSSGSTSTYIAVFNLTKP